MAISASLIAMRSAVSSEYRCDGLDATIVGTDRKDVIVGTDGPDVIVGLGKNDIIDGRAGDNVICGGRGADDIEAGAGNDRIFGQRNRSTSWGGTSPDILDGGPGDDVIDGGRRGPGDTVDFSWAGSGVTVNARRHTADGTSSGHDQLFHVGKVWGTRHDDKFVHVFTVSAGAGDDVVRGAAEAFGSYGEDWIVAAQYGGALHGGGGADVLRGRDGLDYLWGDDGDDVLDGGPGADTGDGGLETDTCFEVETRMSCELPGPVADPVDSTGRVWARTSGGWISTCAVQADRSLWCWGSSSFGQLGLGDSTDRHVPTRVGIHNDWVDISAGGNFACGFRTDRSLWCWGYNGYGQLGLGDTTNRYVPTKVGTASDWAKISAGGIHTCGVRSDRSLWCWGYNGYGQLGLGDTADRLVPTRVAGPDRDLGHGRYRRHPHVWGALGRVAVVLG